MLWGSRAVGRLIFAAWTAITHLAPVRRERVVVLPATPRAKHEPNCIGRQPKDSAEQVPMGRCRQCDRSALPIWHLSKAVCSHLIALSSVLLYFDRASAAWVGQHERHRLEGTVPRKKAPIHDERHRFTIKGTVSKIRAAVGPGRQVSDKKEQVCRTQLRSFGKVGASNAWT